MSTSDASIAFDISRGGDTRRAYQGFDDGGEASQSALADGLGTRLGPAVTFATTEHFNLRTARAVTVSEANGRASIYPAALSGNVIALAFVGQVSGLGAAFYAYANRIALLEGLETEAEYVSAWCGDGYRTNLPLEDVTGGRAWIAYEYGGEPLDPEHGGRARLLVEDRPGFWEAAGYRNYGEPWQEQ